MTKESFFDVNPGIAVAVAFTASFLVLILTPAGVNDLTGRYYELLDLNLVYYMLVILGAVALLVLSVVKKNALCSMCAYVLLGTSFFLPSLVNFDWLAYRDVYLHGAWLSVSDSTIAPIPWYNQWPLAWLVWLTVSRILGLGVVQSSLVTLTADWSFRMAITAAIAVRLGREAGLKPHLHWIVASTILVLFQNQYFLLTSYADATLAQSMSLVLLYLLVVQRINIRNSILLIIFAVSLTATHPFYSTMLAATALIMLLLSRWVSIGKGTYLLMSFLVIYAGYLAYYSVGGLAFGLDIMSGRIFSLLLRPETLGVAEPLPYYGVVARQAYKFLVLPSVLLLWFFCFLRGRISKNTKLLATGYSVSGLALFVVFIHVPGFEGRIVAMGILGVSLLASLQLGIFCQSKTLLKRVPALLLLVLLVSVPYVLTLEPPVLGRTITPRFVEVVSFSQHFSGTIFAVPPMGVYLAYVDPYGDRIVSLVSDVPSLNSTELISPGSGISLRLLTLGSTALDFPFPYSPEWSKASIVYSSGIIVAYYKL